MLLSGHLPVCNAIRHDYPLRETVESFLPAVDEFLLLTPRESEDGTSDLCRQLEREHPKVRVLYQDWWNRNGRREFSLGDATTTLIEQCQGIYHVSVQADEVLHENQIDTLRGIADNGSWVMVEFERLNFYASFDMVSVNRNRWPCSVLRMGRRDHFPNLQGHGDATHIGYVKDFDPKLHNVLDARGHVQWWHYAYVRKPEAYVAKQANMSRLYKLGDDPCILRWMENGKINWWEMAPKSEFVPTPGPHPERMAEWIAERRPLLEGGLL